jgi:hypothetical protein
MSSQKEKTVEPKRVYTSGLMIDSDLFKLEVADMEKNIALDGQRPNIEKIEHCHFFRTFDSSGKKLERCSYVGGHSHDVITEYGKDGSITAKCGEPVGAIATDKHIHNVRYIKSDKVEKRRINNDAQAYIEKMSKI